LFANKQQKEQGKAEMSNLLLFLMILSLNIDGLGIWANAIEIQRVLAIALFVTAFFTLKLWEEKWGKSLLVVGVLYFLFLPSQFDVALPASLAGLLAFANAKGKPKRVFSVGIISIVLVLAYLKLGIALLSALKNSLTWLSTALTSNDLRTGGFTSYSPLPLFAHPIVANITNYKFATSCTLNVGLFVKGIMTGQGICSEGADISQVHFFGNMKPDPEDKWGWFIQCAAKEVGKGRVVAFADSTTFSSFSVLMHDNPEFILGIMEYLNRANTPFFFFFFFTERKYAWLLSSWPFCY